MVVTDCFIDDDKPIVYEGKISEDDREKMEALFPSSTFQWKEREI